MGIEGGVAMAPPPPLDRQTHIMYFIDSCCPEEGLLGRGGGYWDIVTYIISQYLIPAILYRETLQIFFSITLSNIFFRKLYIFVNSSFNRFSKIKSEL